MRRASGIEVGFQMKIAWEHFKAPPPGLRLILLISFQKAQCFYVFDHACINNDQCLQGAYTSKIKIIQCLCSALLVYGSRPPRGWLSSHNLNLNLNLDPNRSIVPSVLPP